MVAYHFPPMIGSSGLQRTLGFAHALPSLGWRPLILTAHARAYEQIRIDTAHGSIPAHRAFAMDSARHLAFRGKYPLAIALPDRWITWLLGALPTGLAMIWKHKPAILWSTYPIATAHLIGYWLSRLSGLPWIADFRDPMAHNGYPPDRQTWQSYLKVEQRTFARANLCVFATEGAATLYRQRYPAASHRIRVIENGYDDDVFDAAELNLNRTPLNPGAFTLLHSGIVYPEWRNPIHLLRAIRHLIDTSALTIAGFRLRFRAPVHDAFLHEQITESRLQDTVEVLPALPYQEAISEMIRADGLLVLQSDSCNDQVPAKLYEYIRAGKPILALTDHAGDTAQAMRNFKQNHIAPLDSSEAIARELIRFVQKTANGQSTPPSAEDVRNASRQKRTTQLARMLDEVSKPVA